MSSDNCGASEPLEIFEAPNATGSYLGARSMWWPKQDHRTNLIKPFKITITVA
jgi:hypothetical protein